MSRTKNKVKKEDKPRLDELRRVYREGGVPVSELHNAMCAFVHGCDEKDIIRVPTAHQVRNYILRRIDPTPEVLELMWRAYKTRTE